MTLQTKTRRNESIEDVLCSKTKMKILKALMKGQRLNTSVITRTVGSNFARALGESNTANNVFTDGWVFVSIVGDLTGGTSNPWDFVPDGKVDGKDITIVALCFGSAPGCPPPYTWNANCDVNNDAKIDGKDIAIVALHYGEADP